MGSFIIMFQNLKTIMTNKQTFQLIEEHIAYTVYTIICVFAWTLLFGHDETVSLLLFLLRLAFSFMVGKVKMLFTDWLLRQGV